jgi:hypothetical protein
MAHATSKGYLLLDGDDPPDVDLNFQSTKPRRPNPFLYYTLHVLVVAILMIFAFYLGNRLKLDSLQSNIGVEDLDLEICEF